MSRTLTCRKSTVSVVHRSQHSGNSTDCQQRVRDRQCKSKQNQPPQNQRNPSAGILGLVLSQVVIYFLISRAPQEQAYQGTGGVSDGVYPAGVGKYLVALATSGQQHTVMPVHRWSQTVCLAERGEGRKAGKEAQQGEGLEYLGEAADSSSPTN